jgi:hypothetical protein
MSLESSEGVERRPPRCFLRQVEGVLDVEGVLLRKAVVLFEPSRRHAEVPAVYVRVVEDLQKALEIPVSTGEHPAGELFDLFLPDPVRRKGGCDRENSGIEIAQRFSGWESVGRASGSVSGSSQVLRKTYCEGRLRCRLDQSMEGLRCSSGT